jgi:predicted RND superfamily exporter protein
MAISISYGIAIATILTLLMLPLLLSVVNNAKARLKWLWTGKEIDREEVERVIKEMKTQEELEHKLAEANEAKKHTRPNFKQKDRKSTVLEEQS